MERFCVLIDLASMRLGVNMFNKMFADLKKRGSIEYIKFYNYNTKRHREFRSVIKEIGADVDLPEAGKKKVRIDIRQVIDGVRIASTCSNVTTFFLICSEVDGIYLFNAIKKAGKYIEIGVTSENTLSSRAHRVYMLDRYEEVKEEILPSPIENKEKSDEGASTSKLDDNVSGLELEKEIAIASIDAKRDNLFPYTDIDKADIDSKMAMIDRQILEMLDRRKRNINISKLFGDMTNEADNKK